MTFWCWASLRAHAWLWHSAQVYVRVEQVPLNAPVVPEVWQPRQRMPWCEPDEIRKQASWLLTVAGKKRNVLWQAWQSRL